MSEDEFERLASAREPKWWATGEGLIYRREVMGLPGWRQYGSPDNLKLTEAQRVLMMWGDIVGQVQNGGLAQFFENYASSLERAHASVIQLGWTDLAERYAGAFTQYIHVDGRDATLKEWRDHKAKEHERYRRETRAILKRNTGKEFEGDMALLDWYVMAFAVQGEIRIQGWDYPAVDEFNAWFFADDTMAASAIHIADFASAHRDELMRSA
jgi:hypothetical protein